MGAKTEGERVDEFQVVKIQAKGYRRTEAIVFHPDGSAYVARVVLLNESSPALSAEDKVVAVEGQRPASIRTVDALIGQLPMGSALELTVNRPREARMHNITLNRRMDEEIGLGCKEHHRRGLIVSTVKGLVRAVGLKMNDKIIAVNKQPVTSVADVRNLIKGQTTITFSINRIAAKGEAETTKPAAATQTAAATQQVTTPIAPHEKTLLIQFEKGEQLGIHINSHLVVTAIQSDTIADGQFQLGDKLLKLNGYALNSDSDFYRRFPNTAPEATIVVLRSGAAAAPTPAVAGAVKQTTEEKDEESVDEGEGKVTTVELWKDEGDILGIVPDEKLMIVQVSAGSMSEGKFELGDIIISVNGIRLKDKDDLLNRLQRLTGKLAIVVSRSEKRVLDVELQKLPPNIERIIQRHAGFDYLLLNVKHDPASGRRFGLNVRNCSHNKVIVTGLQDNSTAADFFKVYDRLCVVNGHPVTDEAVLKEYINAAQGTFQAVVERPKDVETQGRLKAEYTEFLESKKRQQRSKDMMPDDVMTIMEEQLRKIMAGKIEVAKAVYRQPSRTDTGNRSAPKIQFSAEHVEVPIMSDVAPDKKLRSAK